MKICMCSQPLANFLVSIFYASWQHFSNNLYELNIARLHVSKSLHWNSTFNKSYSQWWSQNLFRCELWYFVSSLKITPQESFSLANNFDCCFFNYLFYFKMKYEPTRFVVSCQKQLLIGYPSDILQTLHFTPDMFWFLWHKSI